MSTAESRELGRFPLLEPVQPMQYPLWRNGRLWGKDEGIEWGLFIRTALFHLMLAKGWSSEGAHCGAGPSIALRLHLICFSLYLRLRWPFPSRSTCLFLYLDRHHGRWERHAWLDRGRPVYTP